MKTGIIIFAVIISITKGCFVKDEPRDEHSYKSMTYFCEQEEKMNPKRNCSTLETLTTEDVEDVKEFKYECRSVPGRKNFRSEDFERFSHLWVVDLSHTQMSRYLKFPYSSNVRKIDISNNWLESLPSDAFTTAKNVSIINCSHNALQSFNNLFKTLHSLEELDLSFNEITLVQNEFIDNENLRYLNLKGNLIVRFKFRTILSSLNHAIMVNFSANMIKELDVSCTTQKCPYGGFNDDDYFENIRHFIATGNKIQDASGLLLKPGPNLTVLDISCDTTKENTTCYFRGFSNGNRFENLNYLNASGKQIENASIILGKIGSEIKTLDLSWNHIETIGRDMLKSFNNLEKFIWKHADITHIDNNAFDSQKKLQELDLSSNLLKQIGFSETFEQLTTLHLHGNKLESMDSINPTHFPKLTSLTVSMNNFTCDFRDTFLETWNNVIQLYHHKKQIDGNSCKTIV